MTIKQQGGIFGRNPTFNDVTVEGTLTTSGAVAFDELTVDNISLNAYEIQIDANNAGQTSALNRILFKDTDTSTEIGQPLGQIDFWNNDSQNGVAARIQGISEWTSGISGIAMYTGSGGSPALAETMRLTWDGQVKATRGNFVVESGYGLSFAATSDAAGSTSELLDDYEEGTWTPAITFGGGNTGVTYSVQSGNYTKIGNLVTITCYLVLTSKGTSTGNVKITGLPFSNVNFPSGVSLGRIDNISFTGRIGGNMTSNATTIDINETTDAGVISGVDDTNFSNSSSLYFSTSYHTS